MQIFVTGATGVLGRRVLPGLVAAGHAVTAVARSSADTVRAAGATPVEVDLFDPSAVTAAVDGHDVVIDLATSIPPTGEMGRRSAWDDNDRLRVEASAHMADAVLATGVERYVRESYFGVFADGGDAWVDEAWPLDPVWTARTALDAEASARRVTEHGGVGVALRFGQFYAPDAGHTRDQVTMARRFRVAPFFGHPDGHWSMLHVDDAATAVVAALEAPPGTWVVADDLPLRRREHARALGHALGRRLWLPPRWTTWFGPLKFLDRSIRLDASAFRAATGWSPSVPDVHVGWPQVIAAIDGAEPGSTGTSGPAAADHEGDTT